eukprot:1810644-Pyramimonas_sp.AAC.1
MEPSLVCETFAPHKWNGQVLIPDPMVTCRSATPGRCYDYFITSKPMLHAGSSVVTDTESDIFPHRPATVTFNTEVDNIKIQ